MSVGLSGNLRDFGIADVFQLIGQQRKTGVLELTSNKRRVQLVFDRGGVVTAGPASRRASDTDSLGDMLHRCGLLTSERVAKAQAASRSSGQTFGQAVVERGWLDLEEVRSVEDLVTRDSIFEVLRWETGSFDFRAEDVEHERDPASLLGAEQILMDGLRMVDEWQSFAELVPTETTVFQRIGRFETYRDRSTTVSPEQLERTRRLFNLVDGRLSVRRVVDLSRLGRFDGIRIFAELIGAEVIKPLHPDGVRRLKRHTRALKGRDSGWRAGLGSAVATLIPLVALAALALTVQGVARSTGPPRIEGEALDRLREAYATRRVRNAIDAYRLVEGEWPTTLDVLWKRGFVEEAALAAPSGRTYYSAWRDDGVVFLAPEH